MTTSDHQSDKALQNIVLERARANQKAYKYFESSFKQHFEAFQYQLEVALASYAFILSSGQIIYQKPTEPSDLFLWHWRQFTQEISEDLSNRALSSYHKMKKNLSHLQEMEDDMALYTLSSMAQGTASTDFSSFLVQVGDLVAQDIQSIKALEKNYDDNKEQILGMIDEQNAGEILSYFPMDEEVILKCYTAHPLCLNKANQIMVEKLVASEQIKIEDAIQAFPEYIADPDSLTQSNPLFVEKLAIHDQIKIKDVLRLFPKDARFIKIACQKALEFKLHSIEEGVFKREKDEFGLQFANEQQVTTLIEQGELDESVILSVFPKNQDIILACYRRNPWVLQFADVETMTSLVWFNKINPQHALGAFPQHIMMILTCYALDPACIAGVDEKIIIDLVVNQKIKIKDAIKAFPENELFIKMVLQKAFLSQFNSAESIIHLIKNNQLSAADAVTYFPNNREIVLFVYHLNPVLIKKADMTLLNQLGETQAINADDVLQIFGLHRLSDEEKKDRLSQFESAVDRKNWEEVKQRSQLFWFEKQEGIDLETVAKKLEKNQQWDALFQFERAIKKSSVDYEAGPLMKSPETYQLESLMRKLMEDGLFKMEARGEEDYIVFNDGCTFNWSQIRTHADMQHIDLNEDDFIAYQKFMPFSVVKSSLHLAEEGEYRAQLYEHYASHGEPLPDPPMSFSEMEALNIYTSHFYKTMNGFMKNEKHRYAHDNPDEIRSALIHSVMCASALRKVPLTNLQFSYRGASYGSDEQQRQRIKAAAENGMMKLEGFVSASAVYDDAFSSKGVIYVFQDLRGAYIGPVSQNPLEHEFLIPATQVQMTYYTNYKTLHHFGASLRSVPNKVPQDTFQNEKGDFGVEHVNRVKALQLMKQGQLSVDVVAYTFPDKMDTLDSHQKIQALLPPKKVLSKTRQPFDSDQPIDKRQKISTPKVATSLNPSNSQDAHVKSPQAVEPLEQDNQTPYFKPK